MMTAGRIRIWLDQAIFKRTRRPREAVVVVPTVVAIVATDVVCTLFTIGAGGLNAASPGVHYSPPPPLRSSYICRHLPHPRPLSFLSFLILRPRATSWCLRWP